MTLTTGTLVASGKRVGRVIAVVRNRALVMWDGSNLCGWNKIRLLKVVF